MSPVRLPTTRRCAMYCRKSSDEGLEQTFNSLASQRECARALIQSRRGEGWTALEEVFEDGGYSGGNTDRPGLQQLLQRIDEGGVDVVVVYRLDRLTRSIADFGRLFERLQAKRVDIVSTTESLDTSTAPGRANGPATRSRPRAARGCGRGAGRFSAMTSRAAGWS